MPIRLFWLFGLMLVGGFMPIKAAQGDALLFDADTVLELTMRVNFDTLCRPSEDPVCDFQATVLRYRNEAGQWESVPVGIRRRDGWRATQTNCQVPTLFVRFEAETTVGTPFEGQSTLPLTSHCGKGLAPGNQPSPTLPDEFERYVVNEYLGYRFYRLFTPASLDVRLARITYVDPDSPRRRFTRDAFFSEHFDVMASRLGAAVVPNGAYDPARLDTAAADRLALFQFMIGNTDWSIERQDNIVLLAMPDGRQVPVLFDLDMSGLVNAHYARPASGLPIQTVTQRWYRGQCHPGTDWQGLFDSFASQRVPMAELLAATPGLGRGDRRTTGVFIDAFFDLLEQPEERQRRIIEACLAGPPTSFGLKDASAIASQIDEYVSEGALPLLYMRVEDRDGSVVFEHGAANPDRVPGGSIDGQTWFRIWSMSKIVTISLVMDLVEDGVLSLDDAVTDTLPELAGLSVAVGPNGEDLAVIENKSAGCPLQLEPVTETMTVRDLMNHEAGFYYSITGIPCIDGPSSAQNLPTAADTDEFLARVAELPLIQQPGTHFTYGINTTLLGMVAERATGQSLKQLVEERITGPVRIEGLQYGLPDGVELLPVTSGAEGSLRAARPGELNIFGADVPDYDPSHTLYLGGEGMLATTDGFADFLRLLANDGELNGHRVLEPSSIEEMTSPHTLTDSEWGYNGYNLWVNSGLLADGSLGVGGLWIGGGYEGTHFWIDVERGLVGLIMSQVFAAPDAAGGRDERLREAFYRQLTLVP